MIEATHGLRPSYVMLLLLVFCHLAILLANYPEARVL